MEKIERETVTTITMPDFVLINGGEFYDMKTLTVTYSVVNVNSPDTQTLIPRILFL